MITVAQVKNALPKFLVKSIHHVDGMARAVAYRGSEVTCPVCGGEFKRFMRYRTRPNAKCPRCGSLERHRAAVETWRTRTTLFQTPSRVLHIAPETSVLPLLRSARNLDYVTGDLTPGRADRVVDLTSIDSPDGSFDVVIASHVLEHVPDDRKAMGEILRVLAPGGWAYLGVPTREQGDDVYEDWGIVDPDARRKAFGQWDHVRWYSIRGFERRLTTAGLAFERVGNAWICTDAASSTGGWRSLAQGKAPETESIS